MLLTACGTKEILATKPENMGNTVENLNNLGLVAEGNHGEVYYVMVKDGWDFALYKSKADGTEQKKISDNECIDLNIDDNWIYYINSNDDSAHKMDLEGGQDRKLSDKKVGRLVLYENQLYMLTSEGNELYCMNLDGLNEKILNHNNEYYHFIYFYNNQLYAIVSESDEGNQDIIKMNLDGSRQEKILGDRNINWFSIYNDIMYYFVDGNIVKQYNLKTKEKDIFAEGVLLQSLNMNQGCFYYTKVFDPVKNILVKEFVQTDLNTGKEKKQQRVYDYVFIAYDKIYEYTNNDELYVSELDGSNREQIEW
jgi:hypothetical protein